MSQPKKRTSAAATSSTASASASSHHSKASNARVAPASSAAAGDDHLFPASPAAAADADSESGPITLLTFNVYLWPRGLRSASKMAHKAHRAAAIMRALAHEHHPLVHAHAPAGLPTHVEPEQWNLASAYGLLAADIVCLQEVITSAWCQQWKRTFQSLQHSGYSVVAAPPLRLAGATKGCWPPHITDGGLLLATRLPVLRSSFHLLPAPAAGGIMGLVAKGFQHVLVDVSARVQRSASKAHNPASSPAPQHRLHIIHLHLQSTEGAGDENEALKERRRQIEFIAEYLQEEAPELGIGGTQVPDGAPRASLLVVGDWNVEIRSSESRELAQLLRCPNISWTPRNQPSVHSLHEFCVHAESSALVACDFGVASSNVRFGPTRVVTEAAPLSDHYPVTTSLHISSQDDDDAGRIDDAHLTDAFASWEEEIAAGPTLVDPLAGQCFSHRHANGHKKTTKHHSQATASNDAALAKKQQQKKKGPRPTSEKSTQKHPWTDLPPPAPPGALDYISMKGMKRMREYEFHVGEGRDNSKLGVALKPLWTTIVRRFPPWIAPNLITLGNFFIAITLHLLLEHFSPTLVEAAPRWVYIFCAFLVFSYMGGDVLDGAQARRCGTSTPLGQLFDHGCDAMAAVSMAVSIVAAAQLGGSPMIAYGVLINSVLPFFVANWEESCTGEFRYGEIGDAEGEVTVSFLLLITGVFGPGLWQLRVVPDLMSEHTAASIIPSSALVHLMSSIGIIHCIVWPGWMGGLSSVATSVRVVAKHLRAKQRSASHRMHAWLSLLQFLLVLLLGGAWLSAPESSTGVPPVRLLLVVVGLLCSYQSTRIVLAHVTDDVYPYFRMAITAPLPFVVAHAWIAAGHGHAHKWMENTLGASLPYAYAAYVGVLYAHMLVRVIRQSARTLGIHVWRVSDPRLAERNAVESDREEKDINRD